MTIFGTDAINRVSSAFCLLPSACPIIKYLEFHAIIAKYFVSCATFPAQGIGFFSDNNKSGNWFIR
jgi:hypothetical protein